MNLESLKYHTCPIDDEEGILLVDIEETMPEIDEDGNLQYYCIASQQYHTFALDQDEGNINEHSGTNLQQ